MRFRRIRKVSRWSNCRLIGAISSCFILGVIFGWSQNTGSNTLKPRVPDEAISLQSVDESNDGENPGLLGRRKLSVKSEKIVPPFSRLPANFEKNVFPPRAPSKEYTLEPHTVIERIRAGEQSRSHYFMLFIVKSSPFHSTRREVIRKTWGAVKVVDGMNLNTIFVIGSVGENKPLQDILEKESQLNGDILQTDTPEGYRNLPAKVLSAMQWLVSKSSDISSDFYTFTDDDCVMNIANIADFFGELPFVNEEQEPPAYDSDSMAPSDVKQIQSIEVYDKKIVNEVTLRVVRPEDKDTEIKTMRETELKGTGTSKASEADSDLEENLEIYAEMDPNARIQIERTGKKDELSMVKSDTRELHEITIPEGEDSIIHLENFNVAYKHNAANLTEYLKQALGRRDDPGAIFRSRALKPDTIYCGFSYDPNSKPHRRMKDKWGVTMEQYSEPSYPVFCHGGMYTMSGARMSSILAVSTVTDWGKFHLEDVLMTGILREKTGVPGSKYIRRGTDPKRKPLMYYVWDSGPRVILKMSRRWKGFTRPLLNKRFVMEAIRDGNLISWNNYGRSV